MAKKPKYTARETPARNIATRGESRPTLNSRQRSFIFVCLALPVAVFLHLSVDKFPDPDGFYHFRHAAIYAGSGGIFQTDFPWVHHSVISALSSDLWYGYHLLILPFTLFADSVLGMQLAGIFNTFLFLVLFYLLGAHLNLKLPLFWPFFLLFSSAFLLHRLGMLRPQVLSLGLSGLLFALLATGRHGAVFCAALASTFLHLNFFFVSLLVFGVFAIIKTCGEKKIPWREGLALVSGVAAGWLFRPNPIGSAKILYVQLFQLSAEKLAGSPLDLAAEMSPLTLKLNSNYLLFILLLFGSLSYVLWRCLKKDLKLVSRDRTNLLAAAALSIIFFPLSVLFARRAFDFCAGFGVILIALVFSHYFAASRPMRVVLIGVFIVLVPYGLNLRSRVLSVGWDPYRFESAAKWIAANSQPGDIVFNARWEYFPELFFWNTKNVYSNGMDPIFQYAYDSDLYREGYHLVADQKPPEGFKDPYKILKEDFRARYVLLAKPFDGALYFRLARDARFLLRQENNRSVVFEVN